MGTLLITLKTWLRTVPLLVLALTAHAAVTDIATAPLVTSAQSTVKPNLLYIMDDSGSMNWDFMPDWVSQNYCKNTDGGFDGPCCRDSSNNGRGNSSDSSACWAQSTTTNAPFGSWRGHPPFLSAGFNGVAYDPSTRYRPPINADGTSRASQTTFTSVKIDAYNIQNTQSMNMLTQYPDTEWCTSSSESDCLRNSNYILPGAANGKIYKYFHSTVATGTGTKVAGTVVAPTTSSQAFGPHYYNMIAGEYCDSVEFRTCQTTANATFKYPAALRWCDSSALSNCQAVRTSTFNNPRYPGVVITPASSAQTSVTISGGNNSTNFSGITVNGVQIMSSSTGGINNQNNLATTIRNRINDCTSNISGNCGTSGYSATVSSNVVTITAPADFGAITFTPVVTRASGNRNATTAAFAKGSNAVVVPGSFERVDIVPSRTTYPRVAARDDCTTNVASCTYQEEMTNFANWWTYYRTRMQAMKSGSSVAFSVLDSRYRVGYLTLNNSSSVSDFLNLDTYEGSQRTNWYSKLFASKPTGGTPLRVALARAGRLYAGALNGTSLFGTTVTDPVQYSCQQNFTLLSTDGYWNGAAGVDLDNNAVGNPDGDVDRPQYDGSGRVATISVSGSGSTSVSSVKVNGVEILSGTTSANTSSDTVADRIRININNCTKSASGNCQTTGYSATRSGSTVRVFAPGSLGAITFTPVITKSGGKTIGATAFAVDGSAASSNTLADVAQYYYMTDLRTPTRNPKGALGGDVFTDNVPPTGQDGATWQHMTTYTLGFGASGDMQFITNYANASSGDYHAVRNGLTATATRCTWQSEGTVCNWPVPGSDSYRNIDDMWHAAVNGRGSYFSAGNPADLYVGLTDILASISAKLGASAAATTSTPNVVEGDNFVFSSTFESGNWTGTLVRQQVSVDDGSISATIDWEAHTLLETNNARKIYTFAPAVSGKLKNFLWANLTTDERAYFNKPHISGLSQMCVVGVSCLTDTAQTGAQGEPLVNFLRGDRTNEGAGNQNDKFYRTRERILGDIVSSEAAYVKKPQFSYSDSGYADFKAANLTRQGMVYVGANDGMLHAFNADTGDEKWAYVPSSVIPSLYRLADKNYKGLHQYYVDGTPAHGDICPNAPSSTCSSTQWRTIVVGGLNSGGRGYYALDVTDPDNPKALWEFIHQTKAGFTSDANLGYSFGKPEITKLKDGTWVVLVTSGYNNVTPGDGKGYLYVLNAATGALIRTISTGVGTSTDPSGMAHIRAWSDNTTYDNTSTRVYGGDVFGNVWRFDINGDVGASGYDAQLLATLFGPTGLPQSVTARPELGDVSGYAMVYVGTGRYLGVTDLSDSSVQSIYAIKDTLGSTNLGNPRSVGGFVQQTLTSGTCPSGSSICATGQAIRTGSNNAVDLATAKGWYVDLLLTTERAATDPQLALGTLVFTTNVLTSNDPCNVDGYSFVNYFDYRTGAPVSTSANIASVQLGNALATRPVLVKLPNGKVVSIIQMSDGTKRVSNAPIGAGGNVTRRVSWRELIVE